MHYLKDIATIRSGYLFREKIESDPDGPIQVIQVGDITTDARLSRSSLTRVNLPDIKSNQLLELGDCLFISRGLRKQALAITEPIENTIATSQFFIIRLNGTLNGPGTLILPEFLAWYINQRPAQRYIEEHSSGSAVKLINMEALKLLPIETLPINTQWRIVWVHRLSLREKDLMETIQNKRRALIEMTLRKTLLDEERSRL